MRKIVLLIGVGFFVELIGMQENAFSVQDSTDLKTVSILSDSASQKPQVLVIPSICIANIESHKIRLSAQLLRNKCLRYGLRGASLSFFLGLTGYCCWKYYHSKEVSVNELSTVSSVMASQTFFDLQKEVEQLKSAVAFLTMHFLSNSPDSDWWSWFKVNGSKIRDGVIVSVGLLSMHRLHTAISKLFSDYDITWFIENHTKLDTFLAEQRHAAQQISNPDSESYKREFYINMLPRSSGMVIDQVERIIAFMEYVIERLPHEIVAAEYLDMMPSYMMNCVNDRSKKLSELLSNTTVTISNNQEIEMVIAQMETEIINTINRFKNAVDKAACNRR
jgi:hypothetical protein